MRSALRCLMPALLGLAAAGGPAMALDAVTFGTNWKAEAEHGGYYQAVAEGIYQRYGLEVTIRPGGPQVNHAQLLAAGRIDFNMGANLSEQFNFLQENIPLVTIGAIFQKEPQVLLAHPDQGLKTLADLKGRPILISNDARLGYWLWLKQAFGFSDDQIRPYTFNPAPFLADPQTIQQGYVTSEPFAIQQAAGWTPQLFLLADAGYDTYATTIQTTSKLVADNPDLVQRFVDASIEGWVGYLYGDSTKANALIKEHNPEMSDAQIAYSIQAMKDHGIVDSGEALTQGIGAMTDARWQSFFAKTVDWGVYRPDLPIAEGYTLQFVNKGQSLELKKRLLGQ